MNKQGNLNQLTTEKISAWLDGQLTDAETSALLRDLQDEVEMQAQADELARTRALLRSARQYPVPHHFTLTRQMAAEAQKKPWYLMPWLARVSTVMAIAVFSLLAALQVWTQSDRFQSEQLVMMAAEERSAADESAQATPGLDVIWSAPPDPANSPTAVAGNLQVKEAPAADPSLMTAREAGGVGGMGGGGGSESWHLPANAVPLTVPEEAMPLATAVPLNETMGEATLDNGAILGVQPPGAAAYANELELSSQTAWADDQTIPVPAANPYLWLKILLGVLGTGLSGMAIALFLLRRR